MIKYALKNYNFPRGSNRHIQYAVVSTQWCGAHPVLHEMVRLMDGRNAVHEFFSYRELLRKDG